MVKREDGSMATRIAHQARIGNKVCSLQTTRDHRALDATAPNGL